MTFDNREFNIAWDTVKFTFHTEHRSSEYRPEYVIVENWFRVGILERDSDGEYKYKVKPKFSLSVDEAKSLCFGFKNEDAIAAIARGDMQ